MRDNTTVNKNDRDIKKEVSLEELDVLCRQYNQLHDEEVLRIVTRFFCKIASFFKHKTNQQQQQQQQQQQHTTPLQER